MRHPVLPFFPEKFFADAAHLSWEERGAYLILLSHAWVRGCSLPNDDRQLRLLVGCGIRKWRAMREAVLAFWTLAEDGRWHQKRLDAEWNRATKRQEVAPQSDQTQLSRASSSMAKKRGISTRARMPDPTPTPTPTEILSASQRENLCAPAALSVRSHASPALRLIVNTEPARLPEEVPAAQAVSPAPELPELVDAYRPEDKLTPAERTRIADEIVANLRAAIASDRLTMPGTGSRAELERQAAERRLEELTLRATVPVTVSPLLTARLSGTPPPAEAERIPKNVRKPKKPAKPPPRAKRKAAR